ncbi:hypothetical protein [Acinetobacter soli]|uniref:hypothetical protein n=1 Tax=Acinetobacter soli TaxID=487316 RepID=UPI001F1C89B1|nr:hypothetical protein [Acinetobacter soli]MCE6007467.1 hypothetical protein [Acinetobacter soli]
MQTQPEPLKAGHEQFIVWFKAQNFYTNLAFAHGDRLFDFEQSENTFRVLAVQTAWCVWQKQQKRIDELQKSANEMDEYITTAQRCLPYYLLDQESAENWIGGVQNEIVRLEQKNDELHARVDAVKGLAQALWEKSNDKHNQGKVWESKALGECADEILDVLEQALKGGGV